MVKQILVDFDGTIALHDYPYIEKAAPNAIPVLKRIQDAGHILILCTMRCDEELEQAKAWLEEQGLNFTYFNCNPMFETGSRKIYGHLVIDDHTLGCPLIHDTLVHPKPFVDWLAVERILEEKGLFEHDHA